MPTEIDPAYEHHEHYPKDMKMPLYDNENPHPEFGKNPNIRNEQGHTEYPKFVFPKGKEPKGKTPTKEELAERVLVNNPAEEEAAVNGSEEAETEVEVKDKKPAGWGKK